MPGKGSNRIKKEGSGAHNWGNPKDQAKEVEKTGKIEGEETPTTVVEGEEATAQPTETKVEEKPAEPEDNTITYEEFLKHKKSTRKESDVDVSLLRENLKKENFKVFQKEEGEEIALVQKSQKSRSRKIKKDFVELAQSTEAPKRNNNSNNRDSNNKKGYGKNKKQVPNTSDENEFPSL